MPEISTFWLIITEIRVNLENFLMAKILVQTIL